MARREQAEHDGITSGAEISTQQLRTIHGSRRRRKGEGGKGGGCRENERTKKAIFPMVNKDNPTASWEKTQVICNVKSGQCATLSSSTAR